MKIDDHANFKYNQVQESNRPTNQPTKRSCSLSLNVSSNWRALAPMKSAKCNSKYGNLMTLFYCFNKNKKPTTHTVKFPRESYKAIHMRPINSKIQIHHTRERSLNLQNILVEILIQTWSRGHEVPISRPQYIGIYSNFTMCTNCLLHIQSHYANNVIEQISGQQEKHHQEPSPLFIIPIERNSSVRGTWSTATWWWRPSLSVRIWTWTFTSTPVGTAPGSWPGSWIILWVTGWLPWIAASSRYCSASSWPASCSTSSQSASWGSWVGPWSTSSRLTS